MQKVLLFVHETKEFFEDGTYRCADWNEGMYSDYKFEGGKVWYRHPWVPQPWGIFEETDHEDLIEKHHLATHRIMEEAFGLVE